MLVAKLTDTAELRLLELRHVDALFELAQRNLERNYWLPRELTRGDIESRVRGGLEFLAKGAGFLAGIFERDTLCGAVALLRHSPEWRSIEIGYWIGAGFEGRGLVTRGCREALRHAFEDLKVHRVELRCHAGNTRSIAVAERLGFTREGCMRRAEPLNGAWVDLLTFGLLEDEWRARAAAPPKK